MKRAAVAAAVAAALRALLLVLAGGAAQAIEHREEPDPDVELALVRRVFVEQLGGGASSDQMRDMIIAALQNSGVFIITENKERADAVLKGSADEKTFIETHSTNESLGLHANSANSSGVRNSIGIGSDESSSGGIGFSESESAHIQERKQEAGASIRLVDTEGDVIWSTTQESPGGKFRGAMADVADRIARQLVADTKKARGKLAAKAGK